MPTLDSTVFVSLAKQLNLASVLSYSLPIAVCIWRWRFLSPAYRTLIFGALFTILSLNILSEVSRRIWQNNLLFNYLITWSETLFLSWTYYQTLHTRNGRRVLLTGTIIFIVVALMESIYWRGDYGAKTYTRVCQGVLLVGAALVYFEQVLRELRNIQLERDPMFLISVGTTLYYSGTLMVFVLEDSMHKNHQIDQIWLMYSIQSTLLIIFNFLLAFALHHVRQTRTTS